jgi:hypothetical protein
MMNLLKALLLVKIYKNTQLHKVSQLSHIEILFCDRSVTGIIAILLYSDDKNPSVTAVTTFFLKKSPGPGGATTAITKNIFLNEKLNSSRP